MLVLMFALAPYQHGDLGEGSQRQSVAGGLLHMVNTDAEWLYCPAVPLLAAFLAWRRRRELAALPLQPHWSGGLTVLLLGMGVYWVGYKADTIYPGFLACQVILAGMILLLGGWPWMRALAFPWLFFTFTWPTIPLEDWVAFPLRLFTARLSADLLHLLGIPVVREGTGLYSAPDVAKGLVAGQLFKLDVEVPCSGIRSLSALMMISMLYGGLALKRVKPRLLLFLSSVPLAVAGNVVRMTLLAAGSLWFGMDFAVGRMVGQVQEISLFHELAGYSVFAVALAGMFALCALLERRHWRNLAALDQEADEPQPAPGRMGPPRGLILRAGLATGLAAATILSCRFAGQQPPLSPPGVAMALPLSVGDMQGIPQEMTAVEANALTEGVTMERKIYVSGTSQMLATIVLSGPARRALHRPDVCLPGQGWNISAKDEIPVRLADGREINVMMMRLFRDGVDAQGRQSRLRGLNLFWYQGLGEVRTSDYYHHVFLTYFDSVFRNINHRWALMSFFMPCSQGQLGQEDPLAEAKAMQALSEMIARVAPQVLLTKKESP